MSSAGNLSHVPNASSRIARVSLTRLFLSVLAMALVAAPAALAQTARASRIQTSNVVGNETSRVASGAQARGREGKARVVTNRDLEPFRKKRELAEAEYERTRKERGLPSKEELRRRIAEQDRRLRELSAELAAERTRAEVEALRVEVDLLRQQLEYAGAQPSVIYAQPTVEQGLQPYLYTVPGAYLPFGDFRFGLPGRGFFGRHRHHGSPLYAPKPLLRLNLGTGRTHPGRGGHRPHYSPGYRAPIQTPPAMRGPGR